MAKTGTNGVMGNWQKDDMIVGIDLGTTNSLVAIIHPETHQPVTLKEYDSLMPSVVHIGETSGVTVGEAALACLETDPGRTIFSTKRLLGKCYNDVKVHIGLLAYKIVNDDTGRVVQIQAGNNHYSPVLLSALILKELKERTERLLKAPVNRAVITVPACFNDTQRQATRDAGRLAGFNVLRIVNESTAASLAYGLGLDSQEDKRIAVYDLGGGSFDISILNISDGIFEVLSTNGDTCLGGDDFDRAIVQYWIQQYHLPDQLLAVNRRLLQGLRLRAEEAKKYLSTADYYETIWNNMILQLSKADFEELVAPLIDKTLECCKNALQDALLIPADIEAVLMVGGSTRVPAVKEKVSAYFGRQVNDTVDPDEVVALGAAVQADMLAGNNKDFLLLDITALSLGLETTGGLMDVLIPRNSRIPTKAGRQYTMQKDEQGSMCIAVYQGEHDLAKDNRKLAELHFTGISNMPSGQPKIEVNFLINADGMLIVKAKDLHSGIEQTIEVKPQYGLTNAEVERMLAEGLGGTEDRA